MQGVASAWELAQRARTGMAFTELVLERVEKVPMKLPGESTSTRDTCRGRAEQRWLGTRRQSGSAQSCGALKIVVL
jgi:hypothetical protein